MVVDTSALVAIFLLEPEHEVFAAAIDRAGAAFVSVVSQVELTAAEGEEAAAPPAEQQAPAPAPAEEDDDSNGLAIAALIVGGLGLATGVAALFLSRRRTRVGTA